MTAAQWTQLVTDTLDKVVIPLVGLALGWSVTHWGLNQRAQKTLARQDLVGAAARTAVGAVEQQMGGKAGAAKRAQAVDTATEILATHGVTLTDAEKQALGAAIEAQVFALKQTLAPVTGVTATAGPGQEATASVQPATTASAPADPAPAAPPTVPLDPAAPPAAIPVPASAKAEVRP